MLMRESVLAAGKWALAGLGRDELTCDWCDDVVLCHRVMSAYGLGRVTGSWTSRSACGRHVGRSKSCCLVG